MKNNHLQIIKDQIQRRVNYISDVWQEKADPELDCRVLSNLNECHSPEDLKEILTAITESPGNTPLQWYAKDLLGYKQPILNLEIGMNNLSTATCGDIEVQKIDDNKSAEAFIWGQQALLSWEHWAPKIDHGLFNVLFQGEWSLENDNQNVNDAIDRIIDSSDGVILILQYYSGFSYLTNAKTFKPDFLDLFEGCDDFIFIPLTPKPASWIISYFHHDFLEIGALKDDWPHKAEIAIECTDFTPFNLKQ